MFVVRRYIRVALRMVSELVLTERDVVTSAFKDRPDAIGLGAYTVDIPGPAQRIVVDGEIANEVLIATLNFQSKSRSKARQ